METFDEKATDRLILYMGITGMGKYIFFILMIISFVYMYFKGIGWVNQIMSSIPTALFVLCYLIHNDLKNKAQKAIDR